MNLSDILKDSNYKLTQFTPEQIETFEKTIFQKEVRGKEVPFTNCLVRRKDIQLKPEEAVRQLYLMVLNEQYGYPYERMEIEYAVSFGREKKRADIVIFGNTFYRDYDFGAGDDTGVYWNDEKDYSKEAMLFFTTSMEKSILGKFDYGNKLRSSKSLDFKMKLPKKNKQPNYELMETLISAIQKLVIKDVVLYVDKKLMN